MASIRFAMQILVSGEDEMAEVSVVRAHSHEQDSSAHLQAYVQLNEPALLGALLLFSSA